EGGQLSKSRVAKILRILFRRYKGARAPRSRCLHKGLHFAGCITMVIGEGLGAGDRDLPVPQIQKKRARIADSAKRHERSRANFRRRQQWLAAAKCAEAEQSRRCRKN